MSGVCQRLKCGDIMTKYKEELINLETEHFEIPLLDYIYIVPTRRKHDSGYYIFNIVGENKEGFKKIIDTYCDVIDIDRIINDRRCVCMDMEEYPIIRLFTGYTQFKFKVKFNLSSFVFEVVDTNGVYK